LKELGERTEAGQKPLSELQILKIYTTWNFEHKNNEANHLLFGTFDYMRAELEVVYSGEQFWVNSHDNSKIDCMVIPSSVKLPGAGGPGEDHVFAPSQARQSVGGTNQSMNSTLNTF
jgi:hypothetical protein